MRDSNSAEIVIAAGSVIKDPSSGPTVKIVNHHAVSEPPKVLAIRFMMFSESFRIGRVAARVMMTITNMGSVKSTVSER